MNSYSIGSNVFPIFYNGNYGEYYENITEVMPRLNKAAGKEKLNQVRLTKIRYGLNCHKPRLKHWGA